jgi:hypothetical protein
MVTMPIPSSDPAAAATAVHEAGHAVVALWLGVPVVSVDIVPSDYDGTIGHTVCSKLPEYVHEWHAAGHPRPIPPRVRDRLEREVMVHLAGDTAQSMWTGVRDARAVSVDESRFGSIVVGWDWHMGDVLDAITEGYQERRARVARLAGLTRALLGRDVVRAAVDAVAEELIDRRRVGGRRVRALASGVVQRSWAAHA